MKTLLAVALAALMTALTAVAQDARDIAREMGVDTTSSVSTGTDRNGVHRDTETVGETRQHAPDLLDSVQGSKGNKLSKTERKRLCKSANYC
jgi:Ni/Co efflux regulator RcnB